jgi:alpha-methylacyl-CoA racemase
VAEVLRTRTRAEWCALLEGTDVCFAPVLDLDEAPAHPHAQARGSFATVDGITQPAPAPRFAGTPAAPCRPVRPVGADTRALLAEAGYKEDEIDALLRAAAQQAAH